MAAQRSAKPATKVPVSAHPLFPAIVALWFAALLGIGMMVLPQALFDRVGVATGLGAIGFSFRLGFGLAAGLIGALLGYVLARKVAAGPAPATSRQRAAAASGGKNQARKPISAMEELGSDGLDEPVDHAPVRPGSEPINGRRRALTVTDDVGPSDYIMHVPLPGSDGPLDLIGAADQIDDEALELSEFNYEEQDAVPDFSRPPAPERAGSPLFGADPFGHEPVDSSPIAPVAAAPTAMDGIFRAPELAQPAAPAFQQPSPFAPPADVARPFAPPVAAEEPAAPAFRATQPDQAPFAAPVGDYSLFQAPAEPAPPSFAGPAFSMPVPAAPEPVVQPPMAAPAMPAPMPMPMPTPMPMPVMEQAPVATHDLSALDTVALVERFASALRKAGTSTAPAALDAYAQPTAVAQPTPPQPVAAPPLDSGLAAPFAASPFAASPFTSPLTAEPVPVTPPAYPAAATMPPSAPSLPAALTPLSFDEGEDGDDHEAAFSLPIAGMARPFDPVAPAPQAFAMPAPAPEPMPEPDSEGVPENDDNFGSLLAMKAGFGPGREFVRIEDEPDSDGPIEPVVVFPGTAQQGRAAPAPDGPSRDPAQGAPFARPPFAPPAATPSTQPVDRNATEVALRDALARLQQMSGAA